MEPSGRMLTRSQPSGGPRARKIRGEVPNFVEYSWSGLDPRDPPASLGEVSKPGIISGDTESLEGGPTPGVN